MAERSLSIIIGAKNNTQGAFSSVLSGIKSFGSNILSGMGIGTGFALGGALKDFATEAVNSGIDFESGMSRISTLMSSDGMKWMPEYSDGIKSLSGEFGESKDKLTQGLYDILSAGVAPEKALDVLKNSAMAAKGGFTDTALTTTALTSILASYGAKAGDVATITDEMTAAVNKGRVDMAGFATNIGKIAPMANAAGMGVEELFGSFSTLTQTVTPDEAATLMQNLLKAFAKPQEGAKKNAMDMLGLDMTPAALAGDRLLDTMNKLGKVKGLDQMMQIFPDMQAAQAALALSSNVGFLKESIDAVGHSSGATQAQLAKVQGTTQFGLDRIKQSVSNFGVSIFESLNKNGAFKGFTDSILEAINWTSARLPAFMQGVGGWFDYLKPIVMSWWGAVKAEFQMGFEFLKMGFDITAYVVKSVAGALGLTLPDFTNFRDTLVNSFILTEFAVKNWRAVLEVSMLGAKLHLLSFTEDVRYFFTTKIPAYVSWLGENWSNVFVDLFNFTGTVFFNLTKSTANFFLNLPSIISGSMSFEDIWTPLTEGFKATMTALPTIAERGATEAEKAASAVYTPLATSLALGAGTFLKQKRQDYGLDGKPVAIDDEFNGWLLDKAKAGIGKAFDFGGSLGGIFSNNAAGNFLGSMKDASDAESQRKLANVDLDLEQFMKGVEAGGAALEAGAGGGRKASGTAAFEQSRYLTGVASASKERSAESLLSKQLKVAENTHRNSEKTREAISDLARVLRDEFSKPDLVYSG